MDPASPELASRDHEWLTLYLDANQDPVTLSQRLAAIHPDAPHDPITLAIWLRTPAIRAALAAWDSAQRRARAAREETDRRAALDALRAVCHSRLAHQPCHRPAPSGDSLPSSPASTEHAGAESPAPHDSAALVEVRRAATTILRTISAGLVPPRHPTRHRRHDATSSRTLRTTDPERFLERERRENDRLEKLLQRVAAVTEPPPAADNPPAVQPAPPAAEPPSPRTVTRIMRDYRHNMRALEHEHRREQQKSAAIQQRIADIRAAAGLASAPVPSG